MHDTTQLCIRNIRKHVKEGDRLLDIPCRGSVCFLDDQPILAVCVLRDTGFLKSLRIQHQTMPAERHQHGRFIRHDHVDILSGQRPYDALQAAGKPRPVPAHSTDDRVILVFFGVGLQFFLHPLQDTFGSVCLRIRNNIAEAARSILFSGIPQVHMRVSKTGDDALAIAINNFRGIADPLLDTCFIANVNELAVLNGKRLRMRLRTIQRNGINLRVPINLISCFFHSNSFPN